ncbi:hypothetical protein JXA47_07725 [Candidatus Sumerlaeota bacterium]|nr:hypothetical protein [Candidatus Sumerlaeota bacterium]
MIRFITLSLALIGLGGCALPWAEENSPIAPTDTWRDALQASLEAHGAVTHAENLLIPRVFRFTPPEGAETVSLTGSFTGWTSEGIPMSDPDGDGIWTVTYALRPGEHLYKFVVNGDQWHHDPLNPDRVDDNHQGFNSVIQISQGGQIPLAPGSLDGHVQDGFIIHRPADQASLQRTDELGLQVTLLTLEGDVESVEVLFGAGELPTGVSMDHIYTRDMFDHWRADLTLSPDDLTGPMGMAFIIRDGVDQVILGADGATRSTLTWPQPFVVMPAQFDFHPVPAWAMDAVWYQIFPERFRNGDPSNDEQPVVPWTWSWFEPFTDGEARNFYHFVFERKFGGDLQGVEWALDYLENLGVTAIYLNPVFEAQSLHKYETSDYRHIDDNFGVAGDLEGLDEGLDPSTWVFTPSDRIFLDLVEDAHRRDMHLIIDGVFNHSGRLHWAFQSIVASGEASPCADWYKITSFDPLEYEGWAGEPDLPEWNQDANGLVEPVARHIFDITRRWMDPNGDGDPRDGIDGWRLDVPNEIARPFWDRWCALVRSLNAQSYTVGELWDRAPAWTAPDLFDAHMNYAWLRLVHGFFINGDMTASELSRALFELHETYDYRTNFVMQNLLDSHDTDRIASAIINPGRDVDQGNRVQDGAVYDQSKPGPEAFRRMRLIQTFQFTCIGAPMIWYGDEVGMWGADDPECRKPMLWPDLMPCDSPDDVINTDMLRHVRALAHIRQTFPALRRGHLRPTLADDSNGVFAFERRLGMRSSTDDIITVLHRGEGNVIVTIPVHWPDGTAVIDALGRWSNPDREITLHTVVVDGEVTLPLGPDAGAILVAIE